MFPFPLFHYLLFYLVFEVSAQGPPPPLATSTNLTKARSDGEKASSARSAIDIQLTVSAIDANGTLTFYDPRGSIVFNEHVYPTQTLHLVQITPTLYSQMAELDIITRNTSYRELLQDQLPRSAAELLDYLVHGYAATKAYIAYRDDHFLTLAQQLWEVGRAYCISDEDIEAKKNAKKTSSLRTECDGSELIPSPFSDKIITKFECVGHRILTGTDIIDIKTTNLTNGELQYRATSAFFTLSAVLAEATSNTTCIKAANQTLQFLKNFGYLPRSNDPSDEKGILALDSDPPCHSASYELWYPTTGDIIEGLSILASLQDDAATDSVLPDAINSSTLYRNTQRSDGVIQIAEMGGFPMSDPFLVRGLGTAYRNNHIEPGMREYIKDFINIQCNYLLDDAILQQSNVYMDSGAGLRPPASTLSPVNQTYAVMVFVQAIASANGTGVGDPSSSNPPVTPGSGSGGGTTKPSKTGAIVGGVVGGVAFLALLAGLIACLFLRRRKRERESLSIYQTSPFHLSGSNEMDESSLTLPTSPVIHVKSRLLKARYPAPTTLINPTSPASPVSPGIRVKIHLDPPRPPTDLESFVATADEIPRAELSPENVDSEPLNDDPHARFHAMSTTEMIRVLNARVQAGRSNIHTEGPPSYPHSEVGTQA
ncbi:hypothetical protein E1B28_002017 [Marasmius oreades]|uniref:Glycoside hydrolase family 76 protein n=1 Tax=Marasmius oreades TaxID=181124 RepID=A0A9P8AG84_9AGAR|nr:uncharacterized protein E1B28_002017 [Marasmius oreades]KAG7100243.1 hypothetical protein E1B28_002017 [Marasmius oreades]